MSKIILLELLLIIGSVFLYRSLWGWLDKCPWLNTEAGLTFSLIFGILITAVVLSQLNRCLKK